MNTTNDKKLINGWEFLTDIKPNEEIKFQKIQDSYLYNYNLAYNNFIKSLCIDENTLNNLKGQIDESTGKEITKHRIIIDVSEENDYINTGTNYEIKFLKSKFINFKFKKLKSDLISYYKPLSFFVKGPFEININNNVSKYYVELFWKS